MTKWLTIPVGPVGPSPGGEWFENLIQREGRKRMLKEFKEFAIKGNMLDMAVGIVLGAAFGTIVQSLVKDVIMPPIGLLLGKVDFNNLFFLIKEGTEAVGPYASLEEAQKAGAVTINYGIFINSIISFIIIAFSVFMVIRSFNRLKRQKEVPAEPTSKECPFCQSTIPIKATRCAFCTSDVK